LATVRKTMICLKNTVGEPARLRDKAARETISSGSISREDSPAETRGFLTTAARRTLIFPILVDIHRPCRLVQSISIQSGFEVDEGVPRVTGSRLI
jgi:hypothetical protein